MEIRNGTLTERGLARRVGLSQSHVHNVLSGARMLTSATADRLLEGLQLSVTDLLEDINPAERVEGDPDGQQPGRRPAPISR